MHEQGIITLLHRLVRPEVIEVVSAQPIIPAIAKRATEIARQNPDFVRSDQGQVLGLMPDYEVPYGPSAGLPQARRLVADYWRLRFGLDLDLGPENVCVTTGATEALAILLRLVSPGHSVGMNWIYWSNYKGIIRLAGGQPVVLPLFKKDGSFNLGETEKIIKDQGVRALLLNFPANPSGEGLRPDEYETLAEFARSLDLVILSDEVYAGMAYEGEPLSMLRFAPERTIVIGAASKEYLIPGARIGYIISADPVFINEWAAKLVRASASNPNVLGQQRLIELLGPDGKLLDILQRD
jgi:aspartate/methionine/tyrosine aminotransferase